MGLQYPDTALARLISYIQLLTKWNRVYNLTAITQPLEMLRLHLLDSLSLEPYLAPDKQVVDVGAGAGLPGIPLAIVRADLQLTELEKSEKKSRFMRQAQLELGLNNVSVRCARLEDVAGEFSGQIFVSRAFASLATMLHLVQSLSICYESIFAMKGKLDGGELDHIPAPFRVEAVYPVQLAGIEVERHIIHIRPA